MYLYCFVNQAFQFMIRIHEPRKKKKAVYVHTPNEECMPCNILYIYIYAFLIAIL